jgi:hypothetical protein
MTFRSILFVLLALIGIFAQDAKAQTVSNELPVLAGEMVVGGTGTVTVASSSDTRTATGSIALIGSSFIQRGRFDITFTPGAQVVITVPPSLTMTGANAPSFVATVEGGSVQTIPVGGVLTVYIGGTINFTTFGTNGSVSVVVPITVDPF